MRTILVWALRVPFILINVMLWIHILPVPSLEDLMFAVVATMFVGVVFVASAPLANPGPVDEQQKPN